MNLELIKEMQRVTNLILEESKELPLETLGVVVGVVFERRCEEEGVDVVAYVETVADVIKTMNERKKVN